MAKVNLLKSLFANYANLVPGQPVYAAAMGAAVWEIVNEGAPATYGYDLSDGDFMVTGGSGSSTKDPSGDNAWTIANSWLSYVTDHPLENDKAMYALVDPDTQDFVIPIPGLETNPVPEPFTVLTASLAIGGLGMYVRRRSGRSVVAG